MKKPLLTMSARQKRLEKLEQQKQRIQAEAQILKKQIAAEERKKDTKRKILIGSAILYFVKKKMHGWTWQKLMSLLDPFLTRDSDRQLFDLPPRSSKSAHARQDDVQKGEAAKATNALSQSVDQDVATSLQNNDVRTQLADNTNAVLGQESTTSVDASSSQKTDSKPDHRLPETSDLDLEKEFL